MNLKKSRWLKAVILAFAAYGVYSAIVLLRTHQSKELSVSVSEKYVLKIDGGTSFTARIVKSEDQGGVTCYLVDSKGYEIAVNWLKGKMDITLIPPPLGREMVAYVFESSSGVPDYRIVKNRDTFVSRKEVHEEVVWKTVQRRGDGRR